MEFYTRMTHPHEREDWTIQQLADFCTSQRLRRIALILNQQDEASPLRGFDMALFFTGMSASKDLVKLTGNRGEFTIDEPKSVVSADTGSYYWLKISNAHGAAFTILAEKNIGVGTAEGEINKSLIPIASAIKSVSVEYADAEKGYSFRKVFSHIAIAGDSILLHDTRHMYNNYFLFAGVSDIQIDNGVLSFTDDSGTALALAIDTDILTSLEALTVPYTADSLISELDARKDRHKALRTFWEWLVKNGGKYDRILDTSYQHDNSPFTLHDWHLIWQGETVNEWNGSIVYSAGDRYKSMLEVEAALLSMDKIPQGFLLNITDINGKTYAIEYRKE